MSKESVNNYYLDTFDISSEFGEDRGSRIHKGIDFNLAGDADLGKDILSVSDGKVSRVGYQGDGAGHYIVIDHGDGTESKYFHMKDAPTLKEGAAVKAGQVIGFIGNTGRSSGAHLHLEILQGGKHINPLDWLKGKVLGKTEGSSEDSSSSGFLPDFQAIGDDLIDRAKTFSWIAIPLLLGLVLVLYTLYSMFLGKPKTIIKRKVKENA